MIQQAFENYLNDLRINFKTLKNYRCDLNHFFSFAKNEIKKFGSSVEDLSGIIPYLNHEFVLNYKKFMIEEKSAVKSINRRLSTLRKFAKFLLKIDAIADDFTADLNNIGISLTKAKIQHDYTEIIQAYKNHLIASKVSKNTIKNYLSDTKHFLSYIPSN